MGMYFVPDKTVKMERVNKAKRSRPRGEELLVAGYFNVDLAQPEGESREEDITAALTEAVLGDMLAHFLK